MIRMRTAASVAVSCLSIISCLPASAAAGPANPDISAMGQILFTHTDDATSDDANTTAFTIGETELVFDAYLNPYAKGMFVFSVEDSALNTEEAYITVFKGLPVGLAFKGGKYRIGFGKLNPVHPHAYPFIEAPRVLAAMLPGDEGFNETGAQASLLLPTAGSWASTISAEVISASSFHPDETKTANGWVGRWSNSLLINDYVPVEAGASATQGTNSVQWQAKTNVYGADIKTKIPFSSQTALTVQSEYFYNSSDVVADTTTGHCFSAGRSGFYAYANLTFWQKCNAGVMYDQYQPVDNASFTNRAINIFIGYSLMEETTVFRLSCEQFIPEGAPIVRTYTLQAVYMMGPHKAHQF